MDNDDGDGRWMMESIILAKGQNYLDDAKATLNVSGRRVGIHPPRPACDKAY